MPLRDFFLVPANYSATRSQLVQRFGELMRKIWNPRNFKGQVPPAAPERRFCDRLSTLFSLQKCSELAAESRHNSILNPVSYLARLSNRMEADGPSPWGLEPAKPPTRLLWCPASVTL